MIMSSSYILELISFQLVFQPHTKTNKQTKAVAKQVRWSPM